MSVFVKLSSSLRKEVPGYDPMAGIQMEDAAGQTLLSLIQRLGIDPGEVKIAMLNGVAAPLDTVLSDGDRVGLFPAVGGG